MKLVRLFIAAILVVLIGEPLQSVKAAAASLNISPSSTSVSVGSSFTVTVNVNASQAINSASGTIIYSTSILSVASISTSGSIFSFWTNQPTAGSTIGFGGGLPTPGFAGKGKIFSITFKALKEGVGTISITAGQALANDGQATNIYSGATGATITANQTLSSLSISSSTHPSQSAWYKIKDATFSWSKPSDITSFNYTMSSPSANDKTGNSSGTSASFTGLADGMWTFKLTGQSSKQTRDAVFKIQIDTVPPEAFTVKSTQNGSTDPFPIISYATTDTTSGIDHYVVTIDGQSPKTLTETSLKLDRQVPGHHQVTVTAFDKAGNNTASSADLQIEGFPGPTITGYPKFVSVLEPISLQGQSLYGSTTRLYIDGKAGPDFPVKENLSNRQRQTGDQSAYKNDDQVEWNYFYRATLTPGKHTFSAIQIKADSSESSMSNIVTVPVLWSSISLYGWTLPLAIVTAGLLGVIIILILLLIWVAKHSKRTVSGWKDRLIKLRKKVDIDLSTMEKDISRSTDELGGKPNDLRDLIEKKVENSAGDIHKLIDTDIQIAQHEEEKTDQ